MTKTARQIAVDVLKTATAMDNRLLSRADMFSDIADAWALVFEGHVWPTEAINGVVEHYRKPNAFPVMPGDVVDYCRRQPVWSSIDHAADYVRYLRQYPFTPSIKWYADMDPPGSKEFEAWIDSHFDEIVAAIVRLRRRPPPS